MADGAIRGESARRWRGWLRRRRRLVVVVVLVVVLVLAAAGAGWWWAARGPSEPLCLGLYRSDVAPVLEAPTGIVTVDDSPQDADGYWICGINGSNGQILNVHITSHVDGLGGWDGMSFQDSRASIPGAVTTRPPGTDATVIAWTAGGDAAAAWFEADSAVIISTQTMDDDRLAQQAVVPIMGTLISRAPTLLDRAGYRTEPRPTPKSTSTPTPTPSPEPEPESAPEMTP